MIRRDYILRMIEEFREMLAALGDLKEERRWQEVGETLDQQFTRLVGVGAAGAVGLSETELSARLMQGEAAQFVRDKSFLLARLFLEAGDAAVANDRRDEGRAHHLKGLNLLLRISGSEEPFQHPEVVPTVEVFNAALADAPLPAHTLALLMHHYEQTGEFAKAEDALFDLLDGSPGSPEVVQFGLGFYERLRDQGDSALAAGNLPRSEVESGWAELRHRKEALASGKPVGPC